MTTNVLRQGCVAFAGLIGLLALFGWTVRIPALYGDGLGLASMKPATALLLMLASIAYSLERQGGTGGRDRGLRLVLRPSLAIVTTLGGIAVLAAHGRENHLVTTFTIELLTMSVSGQPVGLPSVLTGIAFALLGMAVLLRKGSLFARGVLLYITLAIVSFALLGMLFIATIPATSAFHHLALPTAGGLALLALGGLLADPDEGVVGALRRPGPASIYLRLSLSAAIAVPVVLGWMRVYLHREFGIPVEAGIATYAVSILLVFSSIAVLTARTVERLDAGASAYIEAAPEAMLVLDGGGRVRRVNRQATKLFAAEARSLLGIAVESLFPDAADPASTQLWTLDAASDGPPATGNAASVTARRRDGSQFRAQVTLSPVQSGTGRFLIAVVADVTEREREQRALYESEGRFRETFANAAVGVATLGLAGEWVQVNEAYCRALGYSEAELRALTFADVTHPEDLEADLDLLRQLTAGEIPRYELDKRYLHKSGRVVHVRLSVSIVRSADGAPLHYIAIVQDVTESKQAQAALDETLVLQTAILQGANLSIISTNAQGVITTFNRASERMLGYRAEELIGQSSPSLLHDAAELEVRAALLSRTLGTTIEPGFEALVALARRGLADESDWSYVRKDGSRLPVRVSVTVLAAPNGDVRGFLGIAADATEQQRAARSMRESLAEKETMLREIHHRVKNNLQVISSMLSLQAAGSPHAALKMEFEEARDRIRSMAMIHDQLYRSERLNRIDLLAYLRELGRLQTIAHGGLSPGIRCEVSGYAASVSIDCAIPVGLIANELLSNAFKHGALGPQAPPIRVSLTTQGPSLYTLQVTNAAAIPASSVRLEREGALGLRLVRALLGQIDGSLESDLTEGVSLRVAFADIPQAESSK